MRKCHLLSVFLCCLIKPCLSWDADDLALFDVVEDVGQNFYELLDVDQGASSADIRRAYRRVSLQLHPDKNKDPDAENQFRKLVAAYEILKEDRMREKYNEVLVTGLPDWRQPVYYYRKVKKMGLVETSVLISIILTVGHFLVLWTIYLEKRFVYEEVNKSKRKKDKKSRKQKAEEAEIDPAIFLEMDELFPKPKFSDLLPILAVKGICWMVLASPMFFLRSAEHLLSRFKSDPSEEDDAEEDEDQEKSKLRKPRPASNFTYELAEPNESPIGNRSSNASEGRSDDDENNRSEDVPRKSAEWEESEIEMLVKAIVKFPGGTSDRWEKISAMVGRSVKEVTNMSKRLKTNSTPVMSELNAKVMTKRDANSLLRNVEVTTSEPDHDVTPAPPPKQPKPTASVVNPTPNSRDIERTLMISRTQPQPKAAPPSNPSSPTWTQQQQKLLETAMVQVPKDDPDRWDKIASMVAGKSKEECLQRVRHLSELVKKRKSAQQDQQTTPNEDK